MGIQELGLFRLFIGHFIELFKYTLGGAYRVVKEPSSYLEVIKEDLQVRSESRRQEGKGCSSSIKGRNRFYIKDLYIPAE